MSSVSKSLQKAMNSMDLEKVSKIMDKFESQFEDLDVRTNVCRVILHFPLFLYCEVEIEMKVTLLPL